ncbi:MAG: YggS family pyridoxal phosphate-dependent enzyme [Ferruginibacter sp.]|nr:YggS family pyridoxal phosphate-dependent enzyme [Ferruginibacter sp.]
MSVNIEAYHNIKSKLDAANAELVAVSKFKPAEDIQALYDQGQRDFGENFVQELLLKAEILPKDIRWHFIGHLQSNKVKYIAPFVYMIHGVDSEKLLAEINKQAGKIGRQINCLLQVHIANEETKFGFDSNQVAEIISKVDSGQFSQINIRGLMGMASFSEDKKLVSSEFAGLAGLYSILKASHASMDKLSMGMSGDYPLALEAGSNLVRIGSLLFGARTPGVK